MCCGGIEPGCVYTIVGASGTGKSSFVNTLETDLIELNSNLPTVSEMKYSSYIEEYSDKMQQELKKYEQIQIQKIKSEMEVTICYVNLQLRIIRAYEMR